MTSDLFELLNKEAARQERQNDMANLILDMADDHSVAEIVAECVRQYGAADLADIVAEMTSMAGRNFVGDEALEVLTRTVN
jgi:hypothetical protein